MSAVHPETPLGGLPATAALPARTAAGATPPEVLAADLERQGHDTSGIVILGLPSVQRNGIIMFRARAYDSAAARVRELAPKWAELEADNASLREQLASEQAAREAQRAEHQAIAADYASRILERDQARQELSAITAVVTEHMQGCQAGRDALQRQLDARDRHLAELMTPGASEIIADRASARTVVTEMIDRFRPTGGLLTASASAAELARWHKRAGLDATPGAGAPTTPPKET